MDRELEALLKIRLHVAGMAKGYLRAGQFDGASACLRLV